jgi:multidrug efflux system membrane fusion protein
MLVDTLHEATVVPVAAVQRGNQGTFVYVVKPDNTVTVRPVKLGPTQREIVAIESGVTPGEQVVTDGADRLREGARIEIADRSQRPEKGGKGRGGGGGGKGKGNSGEDRAAEGGKGKGGEGRSADGAPAAANASAAPAADKADVAPPDGAQKGEGRRRRRSEDGSPPGKAQQGQP